MIDKLRSIAVFATIVEQGTFRAAALHLGLAPSRISETVSALEKDIGVTLLYRSTRSLSLTQEGRLLYEQARAMMDAAESGLDAINPTSPDPHGELRVTSPAFVIQTGLMDQFTAFAKAYPNVTLDIDFSDAPRDLIRDGFDVSIRAGWLENSDLMTRNIGYADRLLVASPAYVKDKGTPSAPDDLEHWNWVRFSMRANHTELTSKAGGDKVSVTGQSTLKVNSVSALYEFAIRGLGVTAIPEHLATRGFNTGALVHVLPDWELTPLGLHAVWPNQSHRENLTTIFVRFLAQSGTSI